MSYDPEIHQRRSIRLPGYDYSQAGPYFVTLVTYDRICLFGKIKESHMALNLAGLCVQTGLQSLSNLFPLSLNEMVVMPNHLHFILTITQTDHTLSKPTKVNKSHARTLGAIIQNFKSTTTRKINAQTGNKGFPIWQRNYYEHIVRDQNDYERIADYIRCNPQNWENDELIV
ncbi:MAG: transposase [Leptolinea sp.]